MFTYSINNQPYLDLEAHIPFQELLDMEKDIMVSIAKSRREIIDGGAAGHNTYKNDYQRDKVSLQDISWPKVLRDPANPNYKYYEALNFDEFDCRFFNKYTHDTTQLGQILEIRSFRPGNYHLKHLAAKCGNLPWYDNFPQFTKWIYNLKIFSQIGKIMFVFNSPNEPQVIHRDQHVGHCDNFLLLNLHPERKEFFVLDDAENEHVIKSRAFVFDTRTYHGTRGLSNYGWTVRIDGVFNKEWLRTIGLEQHFDCHLG